MHNNKTNYSCKIGLCKIGDYSYYFNANFSFQSYGRDACHDLFQNAMSFKEVAVVTVKGNSFRIHLSFTSKEKVASSTKNLN